MRKGETDFNTWFSLLCDLLKEEDGIDFDDMDSVKQDYEDGADLFDVRDEIREEYK